MIRNLTIALAAVSALGLAAVGTASTANAGGHVKFGFHHKPFHGFHHKPHFFKPHFVKPYAFHKAPHCFYVYKWGYPKQVCTY